VRFAFLGKLLCALAVATLVGFVRALEAAAAFGGFGAREVAQVVVFCFGVGAGGLVEGYDLC
jgi:hypothetical protein